MRRLKSKGSNLGAFLGVNTIVFDLDDTLFPESEFALSGYRAVHEWQLPRFGIKSFLDDALEIYASADRNRLFNRVLEKNGFPGDAEVIREMVKHFREHLPTLSLYEDAEWILNHYKSQRKNLAIITDGFAISQQNKVQALKLEPYFQRIIYTDALGGRPFWKPNPAAFQMVMQEFKGDPREFVYIADNPLKDFLAPKSLGWHTVHIVRESGVYKGVDVPESHLADRTVRSLRELHNL